MKKNVDWNHLEKTASLVLNETKKVGATEAEVSLGLESGLSSTVRMGQVETIEFNHDKSLALTVYFGKRKGTVTTTDLSETALRSLIDKACRIAEYTEEDAANGLASKESIAEEIPNLDLYHPEEITGEKAIEFAKECESFGLKADPRIVNSEGATFSSHTHFRVYANSHGFMGSYPSSRYSLSCVLVGKDKDSMQRDYDYTVARDVKDLWSAEKVGLRAAEKTVNRLNAKKIKTCEVPVIFEAYIATSLFSHLIAAISGSSLYRKASFLLDHLGEPIFPKFMTIKESPHIPKALGSAPFDHEGVKNYEHNIISEGVLRSYVLSSYSARKLGLKTTGNAGGVHNLQVSQSDRSLSLPSLIEKMDKGLLVTELLGHGVNIITGDYSRGAAGFWIENGKIQYPVEEITIASNLKDMFSNVLAIGNDIETRGNIMTGSVLIEKMMVGGS